MAALSEMYQDDAVGGVSLDDHVGNTQVSWGLGKSGIITSNHGAIILVVSAFAGLWLIKTFMKGTLPS